MMKRIGWLIFSLLTLFSLTKAYCQHQDVDFHLNAHLLPGKKVLKVKRDFHDIYIWVLGQNNEVYRVNSLTLAIDDYSSQFAAYSNLQFVDIMGRSADTVFIATNSTNVIELKKATLKVIGSSDGIPGTVNSLGIDLGWNLNNNATRYMMLIATDHGLRTFDLKKQTIGFLPDTGAYATNSKIAKSRIFESTYRRENYKDSSGANDSGWQDAATRYMPVIYNTNEPNSPGYAQVCSYIWEGNNKFGNQVNTVLALNNVTGVNYDGFFASYFWGSENGMFQTEAAYSYNIAVDKWSQYLTGIRVNKITDIMGLTAFSNFYDSELIKQNLLIGTNNGFYFSSTVYNYAGFPPGKFALFHDDELGNKVINDICVNSVPNAKPICENGVWLGADDGLYLLKPDYGKYSNNQQQKFIAFSNQPDTLSQIKLCTFSQATAEVRGGDYNNIQWYKDGAELPGESKNTLIITAAGDYNAVIYDPCEAIHMESNHLKVSIIAGPVFSFDYPDKIQQCDKTPYTLKTENNPGYHYRWYTNSILNGDTTSTFKVTKTGKYKVEVSACTNSWVPSKEVEVDLVSLPVPKIRADKPVYCAEDIAALSVNVQADPGYTINWYRDGTLLTNDKDLTTINETTAGSYTTILSSAVSSCTQPSAPLQLAFTTAPVFTFNYPAQLQYCDGTPLTLKVSGSPGYQYRWYQDGTLTGDVTAALKITQSGKYKVDVSSCANSWVTSNEVQVTFIQVPVPVIRADKPAYCIGDNATLSLVGPVDPDITYSWYKDDVLLPNSGNGGSVTTSADGRYTLKETVSAANTDGTFCSQSSEVKTIIFNPPPTVSIEKKVTTTICDGQIINLLARYSGGTVKWSTGETADQIGVSTPGNYKVTITSPAGCQAVADVDVAFLPNPVISIKDTSICPYKHQTVTLTAPAGFAQYAWNNQPGGQTYQVTFPQTVSLTVTDANGCQATQQVKVIDQCPEVFIPNTFTPNGDGINDTWIVEGLDQTAEVKVFTRYGTQVFDSKGYSAPWNGEYQGKRLPTGVYYYVVTAKNGSQKFSGSLTIIY